MAYNWNILIVDLHVSHGGGQAQKNISSVLLWAPASMGKKHWLVCPVRLVASQEYVVIFPQCQYSQQRSQLEKPYSYIHILHN